jgi:hypothetical protein
VLHAPLSLLIPKGRLTQTFESVIESIDAGQTSARTSTITATSASGSGQGTPATSTVLVNPNPSSFSVSIDASSIDETGLGTLTIIKPATAAGTLTFNVKPALSVQPVSGVPGKSFDIVVGQSGSLDFQLKGFAANKNYTLIAILPSKDESQPVTWRVPQTPTGNAKRSGRRS